MHSPSRRFWFLASILLLGVLAGLWLQQGTVEKPVLQDVTLDDLAGKPHRLSEWDGKIVLLNFWATWCPPCRKEIPVFMRLQREYETRGLQIVGIAMDDIAVVQPYARALGINYPVLMGNDRAIALATAYGNQTGVLPYSVILDRNGNAQVHKGELTEAEARRLIAPLL